eukprot:TRINITY_DN2186_c0_g1::TRINITY_DN2186_c0_g1_i1::g.12866::m.12866 TRINITY_DN2186_c0_g1::TRINITY_DN2186_c0_g1_i1::g.12866  ORF type:complete len:815 (+),score=275.02,sp/Q8LPS1/LACS6_ARATH/43.33/5e-176,AMP-binding/PF00501.23/1.9e-90,AMP-binding_C/PF13193.1/0.024,DUF2946/PF11162.3/0.2 TRINITY_DN2186_c0_g1_i1:48-2492(+)
MRRILFLAVLALAVLLCAAQHSHSHGGHSHSGHGGHSHASHGGPSHSHGGDSHPAHGGPSHAGHGGHSHSHGGAQAHPAHAHTSRRSIPVEETLEPEEHDHDSHEDHEGCGSCCVTTTAVVVVAAGLVYKKYTTPKGPRRNPPKNFSVVLEQTASKGSGPVHRHPMSVDSLAERWPGKDNVKTLYDNFLDAVSLHGKQNAVGHREILANGEAGDYKWQTYNQINERSKNFGCGLKGLNLLTEVEAGLRPIAFWAKNCAEWIIAEQGCYMFRGATVPLYETLGNDTVQYVLNQTCLATVIVHSEKEVECILKIKPNTPYVKAVVHMSTISAETKAKADAVGVKVYHFTEVEQFGKEHPVEPEPPKSEDIATFCYTSGTTGDPKGALLTHRNMLSVVASVILAGLRLSEHDIHLSYLPLAHVFERAVVICMLGVGGSIGFFQGKTERIPDDLKALRPTIFPSVPRLLNRIYDKIVSGAGASPMKKKLFDMAVAAKVEGLKKGYLDHPLWDALIFNGIASKVGLDRCRILVSGSAPIAPHVMEFLRICFKCSVMEGYGQTEVAAAATLTHPDDLTTGHVGGPLPACEIKLADVEEMGYLSTDTKHTDGTACRGRGEICFRGPTVFQGYYKMADKTAEAVDSDGWLHSGDIGIWLPTGQLRIVDRKKNIFKLSQGEYVAAEKIENIYQKSTYVAQIFVYGDSYQSCLVAVVVPEEPALKKWAQDNGKPTDIKTLCGMKEVKQMMMADMKRVATEFKLFGFEQARDIHLAPEPFTVENNLLTPTFKLKRNEAKAEYTDIINAMYEGLGEKVGGKTIRQG